MNKNLNQDKIMPKGTLYILPSFLGENSYPNDVLPPFTSKILESIDAFLVENPKTARAYLKKFRLKKSLQKINMFKLDKDTKKFDDFVQGMIKGEKWGLLSEAGCPCIADPGSELVHLAHEMKIKVIPLVGPSSIFLALMASGFNGQNFTFLGYIPIDKQLRKQKILQLEKESKQKNQTQIFIETPYRNQKLIEDLVKYLSLSTDLCIASNITLPTEKITTKTISEWKNNPLPNLHKNPTIFLIYAQLNKPQHIFQGI